MLKSMARLKLDIQVCPPTRKQLEVFVKYLDQFAMPEHAAAMAGIPARLFHTWLVLGVKGQPGFVELTDALRNANAKLGFDLTTIIADAAKDGDLASARWLYDKRCGKREDHFNQKMIDLEESVLTDETQGDPAESEADIAALEARALADDPNAEVH
jgi:hypothetical protein